MLSDKTCQTLLKVFGAEKSPGMLGCMKDVSDFSLDTLQEVMTLIEAKITECLDKGYSEHIQPLVAATFNIHEEIINEYCQDVYSDEEN